MLGQAAVLMIAIAGLLYMIGARRLAGHAILTVVAVVLAAAFLRCLWESVSVSIPAIDPVPVAAIGALLLLGLIGAGIFYARMRHARRNRKASDPARPFAPEPVPTVHDASPGQGEGRP